MALLRQSLIILRHTITHTLYNAPLQARTIKRWVAPTLRELEKRKKKAGPQPPQPRSTYLEWNYDAEIFAFAKRLGEEFDEAVLRRAFTHRSYIIQQEIEGDQLSVQDNRDLIKEGELFISEHIKSKFNKIYLPEVVDALHTHLTAESMLSHVAVHLGVADLILSSDFPAEKITLANTFRAIVAALKQSSGEKRAAAFVEDFLVCQLNGKDEFELWDLKNPYEHLLRLLRDKGYSEVEPRLCNQSAHNTILANYQVGLYSDKKLLGIGWGESIEVAKDTAALDVMQKLQKKIIK